MRYPVRGVFSVLPSTTPSISLDFSCRPFEFWLSPDQNVWFCVILASWVNHASELDFKPSLGVRSKPHEIVMST